ncbi:hypothetical protein [Actinomadura sp. 7K507]|uniref:hypothetical protein n=1 Tax=Actinomadura sp. 7K507 TaxID=2530365 RepID=UPI001045F546|nr:hypothetical protein [Actinomadura sp. 7K507]TDC81046.1 hypothetical protein E1285_33580 [Actinomadura sp. 7K507]
MNAGRAPTAAPRPAGDTAGSGDSLLDELRELAVHAPSRARVAGWEYLRELSRKDDRAAISALFSRGKAPGEIDGKLEGLIVGRLFGVPETVLANPLIAINPTWMGKTFDAASGKGFNRLIPLARYAMRVVAPAYGGLRRVGDAMEGFDFDYAPGTGLVEPRIPVVALDYGVAQYRNPSLRTFPIKRTRDEFVELVPGLYLGRALLTMRGGQVRTIAHFALREPVAGLQA